MLTRCPHCSASFRVSDAQLQAAHGKVRCGACMKVFNASEHLMSEDPAPTQSAPKTAKAPVTAKPSSVKPATPSKPSSSITATDNAFDDFDNDNFNTDDVDDLDDLTEALSAAGDDIDEELVFQDDPDEDKEDDSYSGQLINESELSDSFRDLEQPSEAKKFEFAGDDEEEESSSTDESWAEQMLRELEKPSAPVKRPPESSVSVDPTLTPLDSAAAAPAATKAFGGSAQPAKAPPNKPAAPHPLETTLRAERDNPYHSLRAEPINVKSTMTVESDMGWLKPLLWTVAIIALLVFLALQLAWFHFDKLARYDQLRPLYAQVCEVLGCKLPSLYDIEKIKSQNLVVRSHPLVNKALIIDAIVINQATFEQPFPDISLNFSDINNNIVAQRRFTPQEYLSGEAKGLTVMPPNVPVHIALEILDPGKEAVNYTLDFIATYITEE